MYDLITSSLPAKASLHAAQASGVFGAGQRESRPLHTACQERVEQNVLLIH
jgi:hypothetical protein